MLGKYKEILKREVVELMEYSLSIEELIMDYYNIIIKEYKMSQEKYDNDEEFLDQCEKNELKLKKEFIEHEMGEDLPEDLTQEKAEKLYEEKE